MGSVRLMIKRGDVMRERCDAVLVSAADQERTLAALLRAGARTLAGELARIGEGNYHNVIYLSAVFYTCCIPIV